jgi:Ca2+-binding EF-hand superfamily protein
MDKGTLKTPDKSNKSKYAGLPGEQKKSPKIKSQDFILQKRQSQDWSQDKAKFTNPIFDESEEEGSPSPGVNAGTLEQDDFDAEEGSKPDASDERFRVAFKLIDEDDSGTVTRRELAIWVKLTNGKATTEQVDVAVQHMRRVVECAVVGSMDASKNGEINFAEFVTVCKKLGIQESGGEEVARSFATALEDDSFAIQAITPLWMVLQNQKDKTPMTLTRIKIAKSIDSNVAHCILLGLIVIDAFAIWGEIIIHATHCETTCTNANQWQHTLHIISLGILWLMGIHILATMIVYLGLFFKNVFYVADLIIISVALVMESIQIELGALVQVLLAWRILRIVHGIFLTFEMHQHSVHNAEAHGANGGHGGVE